MSDPIFFAPLRVPLVDPRTGLISREWYLFLQAIFLRIGGTTALSNEDLQLNAEIDASVDDGNPVRSYIADVEQSLSFADEPATVAPDLAELQALFGSEDPIIARFTAQWDGLTPASGGGALKFLRADGAWAVPAYPTVPVGANPTASVGLAAVNGAAATFMRSDAAPPLDVTIIPTWTGQHTFKTNAGINVLMDTLNAGDASNIYFSRAGTQKAFFANIGTAGQLIASSAVGDQVLRIVSGNYLVSLDNGATVAFSLTPTQATFAADLKTVGKSGFNNTAPIAKPTVTGSRSANVALASLLTALSTYGLVTDSSTV